MFALRNCHHFFALLFFFLNSGFAVAFDHPTSFDHSTVPKESPVSEIVENAANAPTFNAPGTKITDVKDADDPPVELPPGVLSQRDWMKGLIDALGFSYGLPEEPTDADYIRVLSGDRSFRLEVESLIGETQPVSIKTFEIFGPFSGDGWVSGVTKPVVANIPFILPRSGTYRLAVSVRNSPHHLSIGDETFVVTGGADFTYVDLGDVVFEAGDLAIELGFPAGGAIDYIDIVGKNLPPIEPSGGWQPNTALTSDVMAITIVQALGLSVALPDEFTDKRSFELETIDADLEGLRPVSISYFGRPSGGRWLRGSAAQGRIQTTLLAGEEGYYRIGFRGLGEGLMFSVDGRYIFQRDCKAFLSDIDLGVFSVSSSGLSFDITFPPRAGADLIEVQLLDSSPVAVSTLAGLIGVEEPVSAEIVNRMFSLVSAVGTPY